MTEDNTKISEADYMKQVSEMSKAFNVMEDKIKKLGLTETYYFFAIARYTFAQEMCKGIVAER